MSDGLSDGNPFLNILASYGSEGLAEETALEEWKNIARSGNMADLRVYYALMAGLVERKTAAEDVVARAKMRIDVYTKHRAVILAEFPEAP